MVPHRERTFGRVLRVAINEREWNAFMVFWWPIFKRAYGDHYPEVLCAGQSGCDQGLDSRDERQSVWMSLRFRRPAVGLGGLGRGRPQAHSGGLLGEDREFDLLDARCRLGRQGEEDLEAAGFTDEAETPAETVFGHQGRPVADGAELFEERTGLATPSLEAVVEEHVGRESGVHGFGFPVADRKSVV